MNGEFVMVSKAFIDKLPQLSGGAVKVYLALLSHSKSGQGVVWPSMDRLAKMVGASRRQILFKIEELAQSKVIERVGQAGRSNKYHFTSDEPVKQIAQVKDSAPAQSSSQGCAIPFTPLRNPLHRGAQSRSHPCAILFTGGVKQIAH